MAVNFTPDREPQVLRENVEWLSENPYPGRGIVQGLSASGRHAVQAYWLMGRSESSKARVLVTDDDLEAGEPKVRTEGFNLPAGTDTSLIIYNAMRQVGDLHVVSNGDQTDTIVRSLILGEAFEDALETREYEPDAPNFTPRISGQLDLSQRVPTSTLSVIRKDESSDRAVRSYWQLDQQEGVGHVVHTYLGNGNPLPSFDSLPYALPMAGTPEEIAEHYWELLNEDTRVSLAVKAIDLWSHEVSFHVINANQ